MAEMKDILVPDIGDFSGVEVVEILVSVGDTVNAEDSLMSLESDKAIMEVPSSETGTIRDIKVKIGDMVSEGDLMLTLETSDTEASTTKVATEASNDNPADAALAPQAEAEAEKEPVNETAPQKVQQAVPLPPPIAAPVNEEGFSKAHASPAVRKFARELGADLGKMTGSGQKGRILKEDVKTFVKKTLSSGGSGGFGVAPIPEIDFSQYGDIEIQPLSKINRLTGQFLHRNWVIIPHVTQFDEADITELEAFRKQLNSEQGEGGTRITILSFLMKALVSAMRELPRFNSSLDSSGENLVLKHYFNIGIAVDTPDGLIVPVIRDVESKTLVDLAEELKDVSTRARAKKLGPKDLSGGCISISSLGGIGGTAFTPIVNAPEVAILGVSRAQMKPVYIDNDFVPRLMMPMSLSYDHRVIDGADGARFTSLLDKVLSDTRRLLL